MSFIEMNYSDAVNEARDLIKNKDKYQMRIAELALSVCTVKHGGNSEGLYTIKSFADDSGVKVKTLYNWIDMYKKVYVKLDRAEQDKISMTGLSKISNIVGINPSTKRVRSEAKRELQRKTATKIARYACELRSLYKNFLDETIYDEIPQELAAQIGFYCDGILEANKKVKLKSRDGYLGLTHQGTAQTGKASNPGPGTYEDDMGVKIKITQKDLKVLKYLQRSSLAKLKPTQIGLKLSNLNSSSSSAWAHRSLVKLVDLGWIKKFDDGSYQYKNY